MHDHATAYISAFVIRDGVICDLPSGTEGNRQSQITNRKCQAGGVDAARPVLYKYSLSL
jgi:hypothetical protein